PLNHMGGERRLNVLITRAREKCVVFSNFQASDLKLEHNSPMGLKALKVFLEYAENRSLASAEPLGDDTDSPFEDAVYKLLTENGFQIRKQVGCASYRVDLAVVDPKSPGRYVLGIECDGARYHSSPVARDRDRLRQQILEGLGWRLYRVWSTDWFRNRKETESKMLAAVERAVKEPNNRTPKNNGHEPSHAIQHANPSVSASSDSILAEKQIDLSQIVEEYQCCKSLSSKRYGELHDQPSSVLMEAVKEVVAIESPIHIEELVRRIRSLWGLKRSGQRIQEAINRAVDFGDRKGAFQRKGNFIWEAGNAVPKVRLRKDDPLPDIEYIADEEISEAIKIVLKHQFATITDDLVVQSSRLLGFQATHEPTSKKIGEVITGLIRDGVLEQMANGMIKTI
ncbi:MAG: DUF3320 domain-containing protein, partial [Candidatus Omnitrophica bacterium]|nr:DUF3320 domain-containing protein [Candidatus Omnitrophota bacterium]